MTSKKLNETLPIPQLTLRNLGDKSYEKRKQAAQEVEQLVRESRGDDNSRVETIMEYLTSNYVYSSQSNPRKGGVLGLAACAIGLGGESQKYLAQLVPPVLKCFTDQDSKIRFYACESMYNVVKVARGAALVYFNDIFDGLCRLVADPDVQVVNGAMLLDRLMKDVVTEGTAFDVAGFVPLLRERSMVINPQVRQFLLAWLTVLDSVPEIDMVEYLPEYLEGVVRMLSDRKSDIHKDASNVLDVLQKQVERRPEAVDFGKLTLILIPFCAAKDAATQLVALNWLVCFMEIADGAALLPHAGEVLSGVLPCVSHENMDVMNRSMRANRALMDVVGRNPAAVSLSKFLEVLSAQFVHPSVPTRLSALNWILHLYDKAPDSLLTFMGMLYPILLKTLSDGTEEVVALDLEVLAKLTRDKAYFSKLMNNLVSLFSTDANLLETRGSLIIRQLCIHIRPRKIYKALARALLKEDDCEFVALMVQTLNILLLTSSELHRLRAALRDISNPVNRKLFLVLYRSWSFNAVATLSLCLLSKMYRHATDLVMLFASLEVTVPMLLDLDRLVQLIESPIYTELRLHLLEPVTYPYLHKCLYAVLMLLPQTSAFNTLRTRLSSISDVIALRIPPAPASEAVDVETGLDLSEMIDHFSSLQRRQSDRRHREIIERAQRARQLALSPKENP